MRRGEQAKSMELAVTRLALDEARHRHANEFAAALATLHLVKAGRRNSPDLLENAIRRLECQLKLERLLLHPHSDNIAVSLHTMAALIAEARGAADLLIVKAQTVSIPNPTLQRAILFIAYELMINALKRSEPDSISAVKLSRQGSHLWLAARNHITPNTKQNRGSGSGHEIIESFAKGLGGFVRARRSDHRYSVLVKIPLAHD